MITDINDSFNKRLSVGSDIICPNAAAFCNPPSFCFAESTPEIDEKGVLFERMHAKVHQARKNCFIVFQANKFPLFHRDEETAFFDADVSGILQIGKSG